MPFLVDTNILLRSVDTGHPMNPDAVNAVITLRDRGEQLYIVPQNLIEFWNVCTRPIQRNGLGRTATEAETEINRLKQLFPLLLDTEAIYQEWERLVITYKVIGVNVHDARLVAAMLVHGLTHILTFNSEFGQSDEFSSGTNSCDILCSPDFGFSRKTQKSSHPAQQRKARWLQRVLRFSEPPDC